MRSWLRWLVLALIVAGIGAFYALGWQEHFSWQSIRANIDELRETVNANLQLAVVVFFLLYVLLTALSVPAAWIMTIVAGALFGRFCGAGIAVLAATVGATLAFLSSRFLLGEWVQARFGARLEAINRGFERDGAFYLFSLRLVVLFPFFLVNLAMGLTPIRTWTYCWVSLLGMLPGSLLYANAGAELSLLNEPSDILSLGMMVSLALLGIAPLLFRKLLQWIKEPSTQ